MATKVPGALYRVYALIDPYFKTNRESGIANSGSPGYHTSREDLLEQKRSSDYSIQCPADKRGDSSYASGIDIGFFALSELITLHKRMRKACEDNDPRVEPVREHIGTLDGVHVSGYNRVATGSGSRSRVGWTSSGFSDSSHLSHAHISILRDYCNNDNLMRGVAELIAGVLPGTFGWQGDGPAPKPVYLPVYVTLHETRCIKQSDGSLYKMRPEGYPIDTGLKVENVDGKPWLFTANMRYDMDDLQLLAPPPPPPPPPAELPTFWVDPKQVDTFLYGLSDKTTATKERAPAFKIDTAAEYVERDGKRWVKTDAEWRYAEAFLTTTQPVVERLGTFNFHRSTDPSTTYPAWSKRKARAFALVEAMDCSVLFVQECHHSGNAALDQRPPGFDWFQAGNVGVGWKADVWDKLHDNVYDLLTGDDDRYAVAVVLKHKVTGKEFKMVSTHYTNREGPDGGDAWRLGQAKETLKIKNIDILAGDFNDNGPVYDYLLRAAGLTELMKKLVPEVCDGMSGSQIDNILTTAETRVLRAWTVSARSGAFAGASDHDGQCTELLLS